VIERSTTSSSPNVDEPGRRLVGLEQIVEGLYRLGARVAHADHVHVHVHTRGQPQRRGRDGGGNGAHGARMPGHRKHRNAPGLRGSDLLDLQRPEP
jgi:hypothetical protein